MFALFRKKCIHGLIIGLFPPSANLLTFACFILLTSSLNISQVLRLSGSAKRKTTDGEILNLMSVDAQKLQVSSHQVKDQKTVKSDD